jgi:hypothetical protein
MPHRYADRIAQALSQIKDEEEVWGEITVAMQRQIEDLLEGVLPSERQVAVRVYMLTLETSGTTVTRKAVVVK